MKTQYQSIRTSIWLIVLCAAVSLMPGCKDTGAGDQSTTGTNPLPQANPLRDGTVGCYTPAFGAASASQIGCGIVNTFGDPFFDQRFNEEVFLQQQFFSGVPAQVYAFDECSINNAGAYAFPNGTILFGRWMAVKTIFDTGSELPVAGILAHEWGHQLQFLRGWVNTNEPTVRRTELEADMWSGLYMGLAKFWSGPELNSYFQTLFNVGDFNFHDPGHHGTPNQRVAAGTVGYNVALQIMNFGANLSYGELHTIFLSEIDRILATVSDSGAGVSTKTQDADLLLTWPANEIAAGLDRELIVGVLDGTRSLDELTELPDLSFEQRLALFPY